MALLNIGNTELVVIGAVVAVVVAALAYRMVFG